MRRRSLSRLRHAPDPLDGVSTEPLRMRGDIGLVDAITRAVGLSSARSPGRLRITFIAHD